MNEEMKPVLDMETLQAKVTEFAMKGAIESIKEFYSGYNSPFRKAIDKELSEKKISGSLELPDIIALINQSLSKEIDTIANQAVAQTFIPLVTRFLTRAEKEIKFSDILRAFIEELNIESSEDCTVSIEEDHQYHWLDVNISKEGNAYAFTMHIEHDKKAEDDKKQKYMILSLPRSEARTRTTMTLIADNVRLELPFTRDVLSDKFTSYIATLIIARSIITMDCDDFEEDMFPEKCHC